MSLSPDELRALAGIGEQLERSDPDLAGVLGDAAPRRWCRRVLAAVCAGALLCVASAFLASVLHVRAAWLLLVLPVLLSPLAVVWAGDRRNSAGG